MQLIPLVAIGVSRDGKSVRPPLNKPFDFTAEEKTDLDRMKAEHGVESYRLPVNEVVATEVAAPVAQTAAEKKAAKKAADEAAAAEKLAAEAAAGGNTEL